MPITQEGQGDLALVLMLERIIRDIRRDCLSLVANNMGCHFGQPHAQPPQLQSGNAAVLRRLVPAAYDGRYAAKPAHFWCYDAGQFGHWLLTRGD